MSERIARYRGSMPLPRRDATSAGRRRAGWFSVLVLTALVSLSCSGGGSTNAGGSGQPSPRPASPAKVSIVSPTDGQVVHGSTVHVAVDLTGGKIVQATSTNVVPTEGHLHVYLDGAIVGMNFGLTDDVRNVSPGIHILQVEFVASDHLPFDPRVIAQTTFEVKA
jgi:hypothetical protein